MIVPQGTALNATSHGIAMVIGYLHRVPPASETAAV
jgi:hypothetical protein